MRRRFVPPSGQPKPRSTIKTRRFVIPPGRRHQDRRRRDDRRPPAFGWYDDGD